MSGLPKLVVFDLDFTLWDCGGTWCDCLSPPFFRQHNGVFDRSGRHVTLYHDVLSILDRCDQSRVPMALASRTEQPTWAKELICLLGVDKRFQLAEIYPSTKLKHFAALNASSNVDYQDMLFFDDESRNIVEVSTLGVTSIHVTAGMTERVFQDGLARWQAEHGCEVSNRNSC